VSRQPVQGATARRLLASLATEQVRARAGSLVAGLVRDGELVWSDTRGSVVSADDPTCEPTVDTQYRIGSITKILTAILVLQLRDEGELRLTDRLDEHLPGVAFGARSLRELLSHSSGMPAEPPGPWWERSPGVSLDALLGGLADADAVFPPGREYHYSNVGYALLGAVVARKRGVSWAESLQTRVLAPLGMRRTTYLPQAPAATGYSVDAFTGRLTQEPSHDSGAMAPAGQLWSTAGDLGRLAAFLADPAAYGDSVLAPGSVSEMTVGQIGTPDGVAAGSYGLGLRLAVVGDRSYLGHTGSVPGFLAGLFVDRAGRTGAVCLANTGYGLRAQDFPIELLCQLEAMEPTIPPPWTPTGEVPPAVGELMGLWFWGNMPCAMSFEGGRIVVSSLRDGLTWCTFTLLEWGRIVGTTGYFAGEELRAVSRSGVVSHLECATFIFTRSPYDPEAPIPGGQPE
jgi:CubicO group peptidase (beta-lactamase class C family)